MTFAPGIPDEYQFIFVDGGVTTYNNPAFLAFQMATAAPYKISWATGVDELLIVSVGTGGAARAAGSQGPGSLGAVRLRALRPGCHPDVKAENVQVMDSVKYIPDIQRVGHAYAAAHVESRHLANFV